MKKAILPILLCIMSAMGWAQTVYPSVDPKATFITVNGEEIEDASSGQSAPLKAHFTANPSDIGDWSGRYEWKIYRPGEVNSPLVHRFEEDIDYTFTQSGTFYIQLYATFVLGTDTIAYPEEGEASPIQVEINQSKLEFPNAFSPNGDSFNDTYKVKEHESIVEFEAAIFSRWGQKIYSWTDINGEWDGKWHGKTVKDGVYFLVVTARGADGNKYNIHKGINVITGLVNKNNGTSTEE